MNHTKRIERAITEINDLAGLSEQSKVQKRNVNREKRKKYIPQIAEKYSLSEDNLRMILG